MFLHLCFYILWQNLEESASVSDQALFSVYLNNVIVVEVASQRTSAEKAVSKAGVSDSNDLRATAVIVSFDKSFCLL